MPEWHRMRRLPGLLSAVLVVVGCAGTGAGPVPTTSSTTTSTLPVTTSLPPVITTTVPPGPPVALIAPSGVPVAVTAVDGTTFEVLTPCGNPAVLTDGTPIYEVDVMIDPGHGGPIDTGAVAPTGLAEKVIAMLGVVAKTADDRRVGAAVPEGCDAADCDRRAGPLDFLGSLWLLYEVGVDVLTGKRRE